MGDRSERERRILRTLADKVDASHTALLVIDVQNDFCHEGGGLARSGDDVSMIRDMVPRLERTIDAARAVGVPVIFFRIVQSPDTDPDAWYALSTSESDDPLVVEGTWGAEYFGPIRPRDGEREIVKRRHSGFNFTPLDSVLRSLRVRTVLIGGATSNVCVESTARDAADHDYYLVVLEDGCAAVRRELHDSTMETVRTHLGTVASCDDVVRAWSGTALASASAIADPGSPAARS